MATDEAAGHETVASAGKFRPSADRGQPRPVARLIRLAPLALLLAGCTTTASQDPTAMIPANIQATVMAEDHLQQARAEANAGDPNARSASVQEILARARAAESTPGGEGGAGAAPAAGPGSTGGARVASAGGATAGPAGQTAAQPRRAASGREFDIMFEGSDDQPTAKEQAQFAKSWAAGKVPAKAQVMITAGPASTTSAFDQAVVANRRLRNVRSLLPADVEAKQLYDPEMPPDLVRIVVGAAN